MPKQITDFDSIDYQLTKKGLSEEVVRQISSKNQEPNWMLDIRLSALDAFYELSFPAWGPDISGLDLENIYTFAQVDSSKSAQTWKDVPTEIKETFEALWIPEAEQRYLWGSWAQYDSQPIYHALKQELQDAGVIFTDLQDALKNYEQLVKAYFGTCVNYREHKFVALHYAFWTGGTFLFVPQGVHISEPLQSYFRMNIAAGGQFEHTIIILQDNSTASYIEGCSAPKHGTSALHAGCVEVFVGNQSTMKYTSIENWSTDVYNLNTKKAHIQADGTMEWIGGNMGSCVSMLYPCSVLAGNNSRTKITSLAWAKTGQIIDGGGKAIHIGKNTSATMLSRSLAQGGGKANFRGSVFVDEKATGAFAHIECDSLLLDDLSGADAFPYFWVSNGESSLSHEARVGKLNEDEIFYLQSRGVAQDDAKNMIVSGFLQPIVSSFPFEYATEMNALLALLFRSI